MLTLDNLSKTYGARKILCGVTWSMPRRGRVGLVGLNGAGKSTLLKLIAGVIEADSGRISRPQRTRVGYLAQDAPEMGGRTVLAETLSALDRMQALNDRREALEVALSEKTDGPAYEAALGELGEVLNEIEHAGYYSVESRARAVLFGLGFSEEDLGRDAAEFSGGIRMRIALARLLLAGPEFLMLDEPTNHLDIEARNWLEDYLDSYTGGIIVVSHDHYFLDRVTTKTVEVSRGRLSEYEGGYSRYLKERDRRREAEVAAYEKQRAEIEHVRSFINRFRYQASKARLVQSRIKWLEKIERLEAPTGLKRPPAIAFPKAPLCGRRAFELKGAIKRYGSLEVYGGIDLVIERGARIALVGPNGSGKSTLMRMLAGIEPLSGGERIVGNRVQVGYFAQNLSESLDYSATVERELGRGAGAMTTTEIRGLLGAMLFSGEEVEKRVSVLSGGERSRLALAKVIARPNNCLLLDEPTNNLDIVAKDTLLEALKRFPGTVVIVSHDRYVLNQLVSEVIEVGHGAAVRYLGNYDDYLSKKAAIEAEAAAPPSRSAGRKSGGYDGTARETAADHRQRRAREREQARALKQRLELEAQIEKKEASRAEVGAIMNDPDFYARRPDANELIARYERLGHEIEKLYTALLQLDNSSSAAFPGSGT